MSSSDASDSLLVLFVMGWGLLMALSLFVAFVKACLACINKIVFGNDGRSISRVRDEEESWSGRYYRTMSLERQEEIDNLRKNALLCYLSRFTLTLGGENLFCSSGSTFDTTLSTSNEVDDESVTLDENNKDMLEGNNDIEEGSKDVEERGDMAQDNKLSSAAAAAVIEYTHISLPLPGCDINGIHVCSLEEKEDRQADGEATTGPTSMVNNKRKLTSLLRTEDDARQKQQTEPVISSNNLNEQQAVEKRSVPIFCAICLTEYEECERVCWASNAECSHVFHEDCILQWLTSSGKKRAADQHFGKHPTDEQLLQGQCCPCCRQEFISVNPALRGNEEESV